MYHVYAYLSMRVYNMHMKIVEFLNSATKKLAQSSSTSQLDAEVILARVLKVDRSWLHSHTDEELSKENISILDGYIDRRVKHEPLAYILEKSEFYGREFYITNDVLVPRPESETMIDLCKNYAEKNKLDRLVIIDIGSGSGALGITASLELKPHRLIAIDIDNKCNEVTKSNASRYEHNIEIINGDLAIPLLSRDFKDSNLIVLANLPYVPDKYEINQSATKEPKIAIFGGEDGLDLYRKMFLELKEINAKSLAVFTESLPFQHSSLKHIAQSAGFKFRVSEDFINLFTL